MKRFLFSIFILVFAASCDDGEIIVTSFDFEDSTVEFCEGPDRNVFYAINDNDVFESISLEFGNELEVEDGVILPPEGGEVTFQLTDLNSIIYRIYDASVGIDYFCQVVPPSEPAVIEEWISGSGAIVTVTSRFTDETPDNDPDDDDLTNSQEGWNGPDATDHQDTDGDNIPDYLDPDDDNDNVFTSRELQVEPADEDDIPNYLDNDDDNDGVLTRFEVEDGEEDNPEGLDTAEGIPDYLNDEQMPRLEHDVYLDHDINRNYGYSITVENLRFSNRDDSGESIEFEFYEFGSYNEGNIVFEQCPEVGVPIECSEEDTDETPDEDTRDETN